MSDYNGADVITEISPYGLNGILVEYFKKGYEKPCDGNKAVVEARVSLPADHEAINDEYIYGEEVTFFNKPLVASWGNSMVQGRRTMPMLIKADTFQEGFEEARKEVEKELISLSRIISERMSKIQETSLTCI